LNGAPMLAIELADGLVELSWPAIYTGWRVYGAPSVNTPSASWTPVAGTVVVANGRQVLTATPSDAQKFFRLGQP